MKASLVVPLNYKGGWVGRVALVIDIDFSPSLDIRIECGSRQKPRVLKEVTYSVLDSSFTLLCEHEEFNNKRDFEQRMEEYRILKWDVEFGEHLIT